MIRNCQTRCNQDHYIHHKSQTDRRMEYTTRQFLLHFKEKFRQVDRLVSNEERIPDITRLAFLTNAVENVPDLRRVRTMDSIFRAKSGATHTLGYEEYFQLLMDAAFHLDHAISSRGKKRNTDLHAQTHQQYDTTEDFDIENGMMNFRMVMI